MTARENLSAGTRVRPDTRGGFVIPDMRQEFLAERDDLFVVHDFLAPEECDDYTTLSESVGFGDAPITTSDGPASSLVQETQTPKPASGTSTNRLRTPGTEPEWLRLGWPPYVSRNQA